MLMEHVEGAISFTLHTCDPHMHCSIHTSFSKSASSGLESLLSGYGFRRQLSAGNPRSTWM